jgi:1,4-dihydroxy-2-naphthoyl-CoA hydrolase
MDMLESVQKIFEPLLPGLLGIELTEVGPERVVATMKVRPELCTTGAVLHGGAIMAFADTLGAVATFANLPKGARTTTIESKTNFLGAAPSGTRVRGECTPFHRGRTTMVWQTLVKTEAGKLCAVVTQTQMVLPAPAGPGN